MPEANRNPSDPEATEGYRSSVIAALAVIRDDQKDIKNDQKEIKSILDSQNLVMIEHTSQLARGAEKMDVIDKTTRATNGQVQLHEAEIRSIRERHKKEDDAREAEAAAQNAFRRKIIVILSWMLGIFAATLSIIAATFITHHYGWSP